MITRTSNRRPIAEPIRSGARAPHWRRGLSEAISSIAELLEAVAVDPERVGAEVAAAKDFPLRVPRGFVARMTQGDANDPLLRQVLPTAAELRAEPGYSADPNREREASPAPGLLHKYRGRVLMVVTGACAIHCRYCFRRHFPYEDHLLRGEGLDRALDYIAADASIEEVILSGGDPLAASDERLAELAEALAVIPHLRRLRIHSRLPIVLPERVDEHLLGWLTKSRLKPVMVVHANHPQEIDRAVSDALARLSRAGVTLLNQAVLLRGINDHAPTLRRLGEKCFDASALPYYLHLLDQVEGAAHFEVHEEEAKHLLWELMQQAPGYLVPKLVREVAGVASKVPVPIEASRSAE